MRNPHHTERRKNMITTYERHTEALEDAVAGQPVEVQIKAKQIVKSLADDGMTTCYALRVLKVCEAMLELVSVPKV